MMRISTTCCRTRAQPDCVQSRSNTMQSKTRLSAYWITTGLLAAAFLAGGVAELAGAPAAAAALRGLGYPVYLLTILGIWKGPGAAAPPPPPPPPPKEWAYPRTFLHLPRPPP